MCLNTSSLLWGERPRVQFLGHTVAVRFSRVVAPRYMPTGNIVQFPRVLASTCVVAIFNF